MSDASTIGIGVPFYRDAEHLRQALQSLVGQDDPEWQCVVVDDASPHGGAAEVVEQMSDRRISYVRNDRNLGVAANFDRCFDQVATEFGADVAVILHADDILEPGFVRRVREVMRSSPTCAAVATNAVVIDGDGAPIRPLADRVKQLLWRRQRNVELAGDDGLAALLIGQFWYCPAMAFRLALLPSPRWDARWQQVMDTDFFGRILLERGTIVLIDEPLYRYRRHHMATTTSNSASLVRAHEESIVARELGQAAQRQGWQRSARAGRWRVTHRANCLLGALSAVAARRWTVAADAAKIAVRWP